MNKNIPLAIGLIVYVLILILVSACQSPGSGSDSSGQEAGNNSLPASPPLASTALISTQFPIEDSRVMGCLWVDNDTILLAAKRLPDGVEKNSSEIEVIQFDANLQHFISTSGKISVSNNWDWNRHTIVRNNQAVGFAERGIIAIQKQDLSLVTLIEAEDDSLQTFSSPDMVYFAEIHQFEPAGHPQSNGAILMLRNTETNEIVELDRSVIEIGAGVTAAQCFWSYDSTGLVYLIDHERLKIYDIPSMAEQEVFLTELSRYSDVDLFEFFSVGFSPSGRVMITTLAADDGREGYATAILDENYDSMEWHLRGDRPPLFTAGRNEDKVYAEGIVSVDGGSGIVSIDNNLHQSAVFFEEGEYPSAAAISPDGSKLLVVTHSGSPAFQQWLHIVVLE